MHRKTWIGSLMILVALPSLATAQFSLWLVEQTVKLKHPVVNIHHQELHDRLNSQDAADYVVFDTRTQNEYEIGHLESAIQVDPEMDIATFVKRFSPTIRGKQLVFYCSVGYRSSIFVERVQQQALAAGAQSLVNLRGGIFRWFNEGNRVVNSAGLTDRVHPYSDEWSPLLKKREPNVR